MSNADTDHSGGQRTSAGPRKQAQGVVVLVAAILFVSLTAADHCLAELPELIGVLRAEERNTLFGRTIVPLGDQNDDGYDDIIVHEGTSEENSRALVFYGREPFDSIPDLIFNFAHSRISVIGDLDSNGYDDFVVNGRNPSGWKLNLHYGGPELDTIRDLWFGTDTLLPVGFTVNGNDINQNGTPELISWCGFEEERVLFFELGDSPDSVPDLVLYPANIPRHSFASFGEGIIAGDYNHDGIRDLGVSLRRASQLNLSGAVHMFFGGSGFDTVPDMIFRRPGPDDEDYQFFGTVLVHLGDINADGYDDFFASNRNTNDTASSFMYFGGPDLDTIPDVSITGKVDVARLAGDVNNDGHNDLIIGWPFPSDASGYIKIYYGGPDIDGVPDIVIGNLDWPGWQENFGREVSGVGDFNGDGVDDFAFAAVDNTFRGVVYIFSGTGDPTDVTDPPRESLADGFVLSQNYPNPFNHTTVIEFELPTRGTVELCVFNILGEKVAVLSSGELRPGVHRVEWDGLDADGTSLASGVYLYRLSTSGYSLERKMLLLK